MLTRSKTSLRLQRLPNDVLCHIMRQASQAERVACMTTCRALNQAVSAPGVWTTVRFTDLDDSAIRFMDIHRCPTVHIASMCPDDVAWFFEMLAKASIDCVQTLSIVIGAVPRLPADFLRGICAQSKLVTLSILIQSLDDPSEIYFARGHDLASLRALTIHECTKGPKQLIVWWEASHARFRDLQLVSLDLGVSDIMCGARRMPSLRHVSYSCEPFESGETYEDARLEGVDLELLECVVDADTDMATLCEQLALAKRLDRLVLNCVFDVDLTAFEWHNVGELKLVMHGPSCQAWVNFQALKDLRESRRLELAMANEHDKCFLLFTGVPTPRQWAEHVAAGRLDLYLPPSTCLQLVV